MPDIFYGHDLTSCFNLFSNWRRSWQILDINPGYIWNSNICLSWQLIFFIDWRIVVHTSRTCTEFKEKFSRYRRRCKYVYKHLSQIFTRSCADIFRTWLLIELFVLLFCSLFKELFSIVNSKFVINNWKSFLIIYLCTRGIKE